MSENIDTAIHAIYKDVGYVQKQRTQGLNYSYAGEAALIEALRPAMVAHGVTVHVAEVTNLTTEWYTTTKGTVMSMARLIAVVAFTHVSGSQRLVMAAGEGSDTGDKAVNKALTGAYKYALRQTFCIETGDDPDAHQSRPKEEPRKENKALVQDDGLVISVADFQDEYKAFGVTAEELAKVLGAAPSLLSVQEWLDGNAGRTTRQLINAAVDMRVAK